MGDGIVEAKALVPHDLGDVVPDQVGGELWASSGGLRLVRSMTCHANACVL